MFVEDTSAYLADFGVTAVFGAMSAQVILDQPDENILNERATSTQYAIIFRTSDFPGLKFQSQITVNGQLYTCNAGPNQLDDGVFSRVTLEI